MSLTTAIFGRTNDPHLAKQRRFQVVKGTIACLGALLLMCVGFHGRRHAKLQVEVNEITRVRDQLQQQLDAEYRPAEQLLGGVQAPAASGSRSPLASPRVRALVTALQRRLGQFDSDHSHSSLPEAESLEVRMSKATLANAEQRFADALTMINPEDEKRQPVRTEAQIGRVVHVLQIRGDSFYGLQQWLDALDRYRHILLLQPDRLVTIARVVDCHHALGNLDGALAAYGDLADSHHIRGNALLLQGKTDAALRHYEKALEIHRWLVDQRGRNELTRDLAKSHLNRGDAFLVQGKPDLAIDQYGKAIELQAPLVAREGRSELTNELARSFGNRGNAFLAQGKLDDALKDFEEAITLLTHLSEGEQRTDLASDLARSRNNRGVARRAQGKLDAAIADFEDAIQILTRLLGQPGVREERVATHNDRGMDRPLRVKLEVAMGYSESGLEALIRTRLIDQGRRKELAVALAVSLRNRGYAELARGRPDAAITDLRKAMEIYGTLVDQEGERDLVLQFAKSLTSFAWMSATSPVNSIRDGRKAKEYALKACELSEWKIFLPLETLAAACAETGSFAEAVRWQEAALELAPAQHKVHLRSRLDLYKAGKPYRTPLPSAG